MKRSISSLLVVSQLVSPLVSSLGAFAAESETKSQKEAQAIVKNAFKRANELEQERKAQEELTATREKKAAEDEKTRKARNEAVKVLYNSYEQKALGQKVNCPNFIPTDSCEGGKYDPRQYKISREVVGTTSRSVKGGTEFHDIEEKVYGDVYHYSGKQENKLSDIPLKNLHQGIYKTLKPQLHEDLVKFMAQLYAEKYLTLAATAGFSNEWKDRTAQLEKSLSCLKDGSGKAVGSQLYKDLSLNLPFSASEGPKEKNAKVLDKQARMLAYAAECRNKTAALWRKDAYGLGADIELTKKIVTDNDMKKVDELFDQALDESKSWTGAPKAAALTAGWLGASTVTGLPVARHLLRGDWVSAQGLKENFQRECGGFFGEGIRGGKNKDKYTCEQMHKEYVVMGKQLDFLTSSFPMLIQASSTTGKPAVDRYFPENLKASAPSLDEVLQCNAVVEYALSNPEASVLPATPDQIDRAMKLMGETVPGQLDTLLAQVESLCKRPTENAEAALQSAAIMSQFYNCDRKQMASMNVLMGSTNKDFQPAVTQNECTERKASAWVACTNYKDVVADEKRSNGLKMALMEGILPALGDAMFFVAPGITGVASKPGQVAASMAVGAGVGAALGGGVASLAAPNPEDVNSKALRQQADFYSGTAPAETYKEAVDALDELAKGNSAAKEALKGAVSGAFWGLIGSKTAAGAAEKASKSLTRNFKAQKELEEGLYKAFARVREEGHFAGPQGAEVEKKLHAAFKEALKKGDQEVYDYLVKSFEEIRKVAPDAMKDSMDEFPEAFEIYRTLKNRGYDRAKIIAFLEDAFECCKKGSCGTGVKL